jgi:RNase P subunit RPR2
MESEKVAYWLTLGVLAMAATTGFVSEHRGWGDRLADRSIAMVAQASDEARNYVEIASLVLGRGEVDFVNTSQPEIAIQNEFQDAVQGEVGNQLACMQRVLVRHQVELARLQAMKVQMRMLKRYPRTIVRPAQKIVVEVPQTF